jgi:hypothetical protein
MVSPTKGFANVNDQKLGMPAGLALASRSTATSELYVPAGQALTLDYLSQGNGRYQCAVRKTFVPVRGGDYEAVFAQDYDKCRFGVNQLSAAGSADKPSTVELTDAKYCRVTDNL